jgi:ABC-type polysaccharide/polyol phosphate transport system ATPase subunit
MAAYGMNAALMGLSRNETEVLLPEIERFAEIGPFIHQPLSRPIPAACMCALLSQ